jgi:hypothetical protein
LILSGIASEEREGGAGLPLTVTGILEQCGPRKRVTTSVTAFKTEAVNTPETQKTLRSRPDRRG